MERGNDLPFLEKNQDRTKGDPELEQVGWIAIVRAAWGEVHRRLEGQADYGGGSGNGAFLHDDSLW